MVLGSSQRFYGMVAAGAGVTRLLLLLLMVAAAPSRARGSGCRVGAAARGVSARDPVMNIYERMWFAWNLGCAG